MLATIQSILIVILIISGSLFVLLAAIGVVRLPDVFLRMSATSKAATLGSILMLLAVAVYFNQIGIIARVGATIAFLFLTAPVAAHVIGRAAYIGGVPLWKGTVCDELRGCYNRETKELHAPDGMENPAPEPTGTATPQRV